MPIYEYKCLGCGAHTEKIQKASDEPLKTCEECGGELAKQWSLSGFQFKGDGWYVTDYAGKKNGKSEVAEKSPDTESTGGSESASKETKKTGESSKKEAKKKD